MEIVGGCGGFAATDGVARQAIWMRHTTFGCALPHIPLLWWKLAEMRSTVSIRRDEGQFETFENDNRTVDSSMAVHRCSVLDCDCDSSWGKYDSFAWMKISSWQVRGSIRLVGKAILRVNLESTSFLFGHGANNYDCADKARDPSTAEKLQPKGKAELVEADLAMKCLCRPIFDPSVQNIGSLSRQ